MLFQIEKKKYFIEKKLYKTSRLIIIIKNIVEKFERD